MRNKTINCIMYTLIVLIVLFVSLLLFNIIRENKVEELIINTPTINIEIQETKKIDVYVKNNPSAKLVYTVDNSSVISVDNDGNVLGLTEGIAKVTIGYTTKDNNKLYKECNVIVKDKIPLESISFNKGDLLITNGSVFQLEPIIIPKEFNKRLTYKSLDDNIASVSEKGVVTANNIGNTEINVSYNNKSTNIMVYVIEENVYPHITILPENINTPSEIDLIVGEEMELNYSLEPSDASKENVLLSVKDNSIIKIENNVIKTLKVGNTIINLRSYNGISKDINVVVKPKVNNLIITSNTNLKLNVGSSSKITYELDPKDVQDANVSFESSNPTVATVSSSGVVEALVKGEAIITIRCGSITKTINVSVGNYYQRIHFIKQTISNKTQDSEAGDAILLESNGHFAMIDTGYKEKVDNEFIYNYLKKYKVNKLDFIFITHAHNDHYGGASYLMNKFKVDRLYIKSDSNLAGVISTANSKKIPITYIEKKYKDGQSFTFQDMNIKLYNTKENGRNINLTSVLELIEVNGHKAFLTGDLPRDGIEYMNNVSKTIGKVNVLKMPHHGYFECAMSPTSAKRLNPDYVIVTNKFTKGRTGCYANFSNNVPIYYNKDSTRSSIIVDLTSSEIKIIK